MATTTLADLLETAVYNTAVADSALWNSVSGKFKHGRPLDTWTTPYVLYSFPNLPATNVYAEDAPVATALTIYFDVFSSSNYFTEAKTIGSYIRDVFDGASLTMTGYQGMTVKLGAERPIDEEETGLWHFQISYKGTACKS